MLFTPNDYSVKEMITKIKNHDTIRLNINENKQIWEIIDFTINFIDGERYIDTIKLKPYNSLVNTHEYIQLSANSLAKYFK